MATVDLKRLAKELNLAVSTVSRALRDSYEISPATKEKVFALAKQLNYQPNPYASSLRKHKSKTIAVIVPEIANNFFALAINGIEAIAQERDYHVLIYLTHEHVEKEKSITRHLQSGRVDGVLMSLSAETDDIEHLIELKQKGIPIVFFDRICEAIETSKITTDDYESGFKAAEHLIQKGCQNIAYLSISKNLSIANKRMMGYLDALKKYRLKQDPKFVMQCSTDNLVNEKLLHELFRKKYRPDGIFASVEKLAVAAYNTCREMGIRIPQDIKVISFSNLEIASLMNPSLTTITQPAYEIGKQAAAILFKRLEKARLNMTHENVILKSVLNERDSTRSDLVITRKN